MKQIKKIVEQIQEELEGANDYAKLAVQLKGSDPRLAETYASMAEQELNHVNRLHDEAVRLINAYPDEPPAAMQAVWDWEHDRMTSHAAAIRVLLNMYR